VLTRFLGTAIQTTAHGTGQFVGGRFILGFGASIASAAGPAYTVELAHPSYRGVMAGSYNTFWWLGNIIAGWYVLSEHELGDREHKADLFFSGLHMGRKRTSLALLGPGG
jgi:MFS family permease